MMLLETFKDYWYATVIAKATATMLNATINNKVNSNFQTSLTLSDTWLFLTLDFNNNGRLLARAPNFSLPWTT